MNARRPALARSLLTAALLLSLLVAAHGQAAGGAGGSGSGGGSNDAGSGSGPGPAGGKRPPHATLPDSGSGGGELPKQKAPPLKPGLPAGTFKAPTGPKLAPGTVQGGTGGGASGGGTTGGGTTGGGTTGGGTSGGAAGGGDSAGSSAADGTATSLEPAAGSTPSDAMEQRSALVAVADAAGRPVAGMLCCAVSARGALLDAQLTGADGVAHLAWRATEGSVTVLFVQGPDAP